MRTRTRGKQGGGDESVAADLASPGGSASQRRIGPGEEPAHGLGRRDRVRTHKPPGGADGSAQADEVLAAPSASAGVIISPVQVGPGVCDPVQDVRSTLLGRFLQHPPVAERITEHRDPPVLAVLGSAVENGATADQATRKRVDVIHS